MRGENMLTKQLAFRLLALMIGITLTGWVDPFSTCCAQSEFQTESPTRANVAPYSAVAAPEWDALFDRQTGWTGADGIYSIPISGDERPGTAGNTTTFWVFSDTFIGSVNTQNQRVEGSTIIRNTSALLTGGLPNPNQIQFLWKTSTTGAPLPRVVPTTSAAHWFWPNDGLVVNGRLYLFSLRMKPGGSGVFNFATDGISLLSDSVANLADPFRTYTQVDTRLFQAASGAQGELAFGMAVMPNTMTAGAPRPDGYLYVYGLRNDPGNKKLVVGRVKPDKIAQFSQYRFWNGRTWVTTFRSAAPVASRLSSEFSVTPLADGRYLLVFQLDTLSNTVAVSYGSSPTGPWGPPIPIWTCPETTLTPNITTYNAKAHPHLSAPGELLISYNVNTFSFAEHFANADIYRPRFIRLPLP